LRGLGAQGVADRIAHRDGFGRTRRQVEPVDIVVPRDVQRAAACIEGHSIALRAQTLQDHGGRRRQFAGLNNALIPFGRGGLFVTSANY